MQRKKWTTQNLTVWWHGWVCLERRLEVEKDLVPSDHASWHTYDTLFFNDHHVNLAYKLVTLIEKRILAFFLSPLQQMRANAPMMLFNERNTGEKKKKSPNKKVNVLMNSAIKNVDLFYIGGMYENTGVQCWCFPRILWHSEIERHSDKREGRRRERPENLAPYFEQRKESGLEEEKQQWQKRRGCKRDSMEKVEWRRSLKGSSRPWTPSLVCLEREVLQRRCGEERQTEIHGSCSAVQSSVVFPRLCKVHIQARGDRFAKVLCCPGFVLSHQGMMEKWEEGRGPLQ